MDDLVPKKIKSRSTELVKPIITLDRPERNGLEPSKCIDHTCHNASGDTTSEKYMIKI